MPKIISIKDLKNTSVISAMCHVSEEPIYITKNGYVNHDNESQSVATNIISVGEYMEKYILKYWFEHGGTCLWSANDNAREEFNYPIDNEKLPISKDLVEELYALEELYHGYLNWDCPSNPSPWTSEQKQNFINRANIAYRKLISELGNNFEVINDIISCI